MGPFAHLNKPTDRLNQTNRPADSTASAAYVLGLAVCKTVSFLQGVAVSASINTMVAVTLDR